MGKTLLALVSVVALGACAPQIHSSNDRTVVINGLNAFNSADALPLADAHCRTYNRHAQMKEVVAGAIIFDCVL